MKKYYLKLWASYLLMLAGVGTFLYFNWTLGVAVVLCLSGGYIWRKTVGK